MKSGMESLGQVRTQAVVLLLLAFLAGAFGGGALERVLLHRAARARFADGRGPGTPGQSSQPGGSRGTDQLAWLNITDAQKAKIDSIFAKRRPHMDSLDALRHSAFDSARVEMDAVLTADQRAKLDSSRAAARARTGSSRGGGRGPYGPPGGRR